MTATETGLTGSNGVDRDSYEDQPTQVPMRAGVSIRRNPTTDQKKIRRQLNTRGSNDTRTAMTTEADLLQAMAKATPSEQAELMRRLTEARQARYAAHEEERQIDWGSVDRATGRSRPLVTASVRHTAETDWLGSDVPEDAFDASRARVAAKIWHGSVSAAVKADPQEYRVQAQLTAARQAGAYGEHADAFRNVFLAELKLASWVKGSTRKTAGERKMLTLPYSEVCMHMGVAGTQMEGELISDNMVQLYRPDGTMFSYPITRSEAGWDFPNPRTSRKMAEAEPSQQASDVFPDPNVHEDTDDTDYSNPADPTGSFTDVTLWDSVATEGDLQAGASKLAWSWNRNNGGSKPKNTDPVSTAQHEQYERERYMPRNLDEKAEFVKKIRDSNAQPASYSTQFSEDNPYEARRKTAADDGEEMPPGSVSIYREPEREGSSKSGRITVSQVWGPSYMETVYQGYDKAKAMEAAIAALTKAYKFPEGAKAKLYDGGLSAASSKTADNVGPGGTNWESLVGKQLVGLPGSKIIKVTPSTDYLMNGPMTNAGGPGGIEGTITVLLEDGREVTMAKDLSRVQVVASLSKSAARPLYEIAEEIRRTWPKVYFGAVPYLDAMGELDSIKDMYYQDSAKSIVLYFLSNATTWRGEDAKRIKQELKDMVSGKSASKTAGWETARAEDLQVGDTWRLPMPDSPFQVVHDPSGVMEGPLGHQVVEIDPNDRDGVWIWNGSYPTVLSPDEPVEVWRKSASKKSVLLTDVGFENGIGGDTAHGYDSNGNKVIFRLSEEDAKNLAYVMTSDLAINFSGVDVDEGDIISQASKKQAADYADGVSDAWNVNQNLGRNKVGDIGRYVDTEGYAQWDGKTVKVVNIGDDGRIAITLADGSIDGSGIWVTNGSVLVSQASKTAGKVLIYDESEGYAIQHNTSETDPVAAINDAVKKNPLFCSSDGWAEVDGRRYNWTRDGEYGDAKAIVTEASKQASTEACPRCGGNNNDTASRCAHCGGVLDGEDTWDKKKSSKTAGAPSDVCPQCGAQTEAWVIGGTLRAECPECGWKGTKTKPANPEFKEGAKKDQPPWADGPYLDENGQSTDYIRSAPRPDPDPDEWDGPDEDGRYRWKGAKTAGHDYCPKCGASEWTMQESGLQKCNSCGHEFTLSQATDTKAKQAAFRARVQSSLKAKTAADYSTEGPWKVQVTGSGEMVWSENALRFQTVEEAKAYASDLLGRWFGADMARVVPSDTPNRAPVDLNDPTIVINYR